MRIVKVEDFHAEGGIHTFSFLKMTTDEGLVGWAEYYDDYVACAVTPIIRRFAEVVIGMDPRQSGRISATLHATTRPVPGGLNHQAIATIENACLDIQAKALGVPVYALFGGPFRDRLQVYWTHCGSFRVRHADFFEKELGKPRIRTLDDITRLGEEVVAAGFKGLKTNPILFDGSTPRMFNGGWRIAPGFLDRKPDSRFIAAVTDQLAAFRQGIGLHTKLMIDLSFNQRADGFMRIAKAVEPFNLTWLEIDIHDPEALALIRRSTSTPIASLEAISGLKNYRPFLQRYSVDVAIIDAIWNGVWESVRIASLADAYEVNIAPHNYLGDLANLISAHFCASVPNFRIMEFEVEHAPWVREFFTHPVVIENGELVVPDRPGWGTDIDEKAVIAHPPKSAR
jgi:L-alanine-DL-glutamate epimerase-like enolase superfamily enzyme